MTSHIVYLTGDRHLHIVTANCIADLFVILCSYNFIKVQNSTEVNLTVTKFKYVKRFCTRLLATSATTDNVLSHVCLSAIISCKQEISKTSLHN